MVVSMLCYVVDPILLKNRKCIGSLQQHRIQQRPPRPSTFKKKPLIQELNSKASLSQLDIHVKPEYRIYVQPEDNPKNIILDVWMPDVVILFKKLTSNIMALNYYFYFFYSIVHKKLI